MAWNFLQLNDPAKVAEARGTSWGSALGQDFNPRNPNYQGYRTAPGNVAAANRVGLGSYINQGFNSLRGVFQPGSNVGGATTLMRKMALSPVGRVAGAAMSLPALGAYGLYKTPAMIDALTARDPNATQSSLFGIDLTQNANEQAALPESQLQDWGSTMGVIPGDDLPNPLPKVYPGSAYSPHRGFEEMQFDETVQAPAKKGFAWPSILALAKKAIEPNTPEENFGLGYFDRDPQTGRTYGNPADNVFAGKNVVSAWGEGMGAAAQKRIDKINETLSKWESDEEKYAQQLANTTLYDRRKTFQRQLADYNKKLAGGQDKTGGVVTTGNVVTNVRNPNQGDGASRDQGGGYSTRGGFSRSSKPGGDTRGHHSWAAGGRVGYREGELVEEDINVQGPGFDVNEQMAGYIDPQDALNDMSMNIFGKPLHDLTPEEYQMLIDMANDQAMAEQPEGLASLV